MNNTSTKNNSSEGASIASQALAAYSYVGVWIILSGAVITYNKFLLSVAGFPYPLTLTLWHMFFCSSIAFALVRFGVVKSIGMSKETYIRTIAPIGLCYSITLWLGNAAYLYLSVSFIQMLKALMPVCVYSVGCLFGTEMYNTSTFMNMCLITLGVGIASYGELNFNLLGTLFTGVSIVSEAIRLVLVQTLLQSRGFKLNPITTLYYVAPCCFMFLLLPFYRLEYPKIVQGPIGINPMHLLANAFVAFCLNTAVFLLIGKTSALTMNVAGVVKDWMLIGISVWIFGAAVSGINLSGYSLAFFGVCWYNYQKLQRAKDAKKSTSQAPEESTVPLVPVAVESPRN